MNDKIQLRLNKEDKEKIEKLLILDKYNELTLSSLIRKLLLEEYKKHKKEIKEKQVEIAFEEEGIEPPPKNKWERNINATIELAKMDWLNNN